MAASGPVRYMLPRGLLRGPLLHRLYGPLSGGCFGSRVLLCFLR